MSKQASAMQRTDAHRKVQDKLGYTFKNSKLLEESLTHDSMRVNNRGIRTYQRLEFLGDSVLNMIISEYIFRAYPNYNEGTMTEYRKDLVSASKQQEIMEELDINECILFGPSVRWRESEFTNSHKFIESIIGATYIDGGLEKTREVIRRLWHLDNRGSFFYASILRCFSSILIAATIGLVLAVVFSFYYLNDGQ